jgi:lysyl-tRNA synthetase, class II
VEDGIIEYSDFKEREQLRNREALLSYGEKKGIHMNPKDPVGKLMMTIFEEEVEGELWQPTFVTHFPLDVSPLARKNEKIHS